MDAVTLPWMTVLLLGAVHGINPAMGWLFAVSLGLQGGSGRAVWRALPPLGLGHAVSVAVAVAAAVVVGVVVPLEALKWCVAAVLIGFGLLRLVRNRHPRYGGMRVGARDLTIWSFLMASAHGAGLMVVPVVLGAAGEHGGGHAAGAHAGHIVTAGVEPMGWMPVALAGVHTASYLLVTSLLAIVVYHKIGVRLLRRAWLNIDLLWAGALILTGVVTPFL